MKANITLFKDRYNEILDESTLEYSAGYVDDNGIVCNEQFGAEETFSIGMPVYDYDGNCLGRLSIGLYENLNWSGEIKIPVHNWKIDGYKLGTKKIKTYYQINAKLADNKAEKEKM